MTLFCSRRPAGGAGKDVDEFAAYPTLRIAKRLQKAVLISVFMFSCAVNGNALTLNAALATTLEKNPEIAQARIALEQAAGRRLVLRANAYPDVRMQVPVGVQGGKRAGDPSIRPFGFARGFFTQPLLNAAIPASRRRGDIEVLLAQQRLNVAVVGKLHAARVAFYTALYNDSLHTLGEAQRERLAQNISTQDERYRAGQTDRAGLVSAQLLERELEPRIQEVQRGYEGSVLTLVTIMGTETSSTATPVRLEGELQFAPVNHDLPRETAEALSDRPDLQLARTLVRAAGEDQRIIAAQYYPALDATISGTYIPVTIHTANGGSASSSNNTVSSEGAAGIALTWRVIDNGRVTGQVMKQRAIREMNEISLHQLEANVSRELKQIANNFRAAESRWKALSNAAAAAEQNVNVLQRSLAEGLSSQLEFRTAENSFLETRSALLAAAYQQNVARAEWDRATGRYFQFSGDTAGNVH
jgi:outer membrane protein TolC